MSSGSSGNNGTLVVAGPDTIQVADFYVKASILHPLVIGSIAIIVLFTSLRFFSNRSIAAMNVTDWIANVAIGSTLAGICNGNSLVRGMLSLATILGFQYLMSFVGSRLPSKHGWLLTSPPIMIAFRGKLLTKVMVRHRICLGDFYTSLRQKNILDVSEIECVFIEANGSFSIYTRKQVGNCKEVDVLLQVPSYKALCEDAEQRVQKNDGGKEGKDCCDDQQNDLASEAC
ncbi:unnamed protein product [Aureobasidium uvarum]|uniref:YetF C-terminal domain-containing protein n=1 Tax=Aureobasidium uvarum TaxID=2773716 RepID=A0A9N8PRB9_9PEZI|nr:unnamed protein product [Aureobasidium uvarum]